MFILITRPQEIATPLAQKLEKLGHSVLIDPLLAVAPTSPVLPPLDAFSAVVTTSQQAIYCLAALTSQRDFPLWCVGKVSEEAAKQLGFRRTQSAEGSATQLLQALEKATPVGTLPLLHASGDVLRIDLVQALQEKGIAAKRVVLYETTEATKLSPQTHQAILSHALDTVLFYSPRTASIFQKLCCFANLQDHCADIIAGCLSPAIAEEIKGLPWKTIKVAEQTTTEALLKEVSLASCP